MLELNIDLGKKGEIYYHSSKERLKISKTVKFGWEMLSIMENIQP